MKLDIFRGRTTRPEENRGWSVAMIDNNTFATESEPGAQATGFVVGSGPFVSNASRNSRGYAAQDVRKGSAFPAGSLINTAAAPPAA